MNTGWKVLSLIVTVAFIGTSALAGNLWQKLDMTRKQLASTEAQLSITTAELEATRTDLANTKYELDATKSRLTIKEAELNTANSQLASVRSELTSVKYQLQTANNEKTQMVSSYTTLRTSFNIRLGSTAQDRQSYITPSDPSVAAKVQQIVTAYTGDNNQLWNDYFALFQWVRKNVEYSHDSYTPSLPSTLTGTFTWRKEFWRKPAETLIDKTGDCEDMASLLASMMKNYNKNTYTVWLITISSSYPEPLGHVAVVFPVKGGELAILDPAGNYCTGMQYGGLYSDPASKAISDWLAHWSQDMPGAIVDGVFSESFDKQFSSTAEFLTWLSQR